MKQICPTFWTASWTKIGTRLAGLALAATTPAMALAQNNRDQGATEFVAPYIPIVIVMFLVILVGIPTFKNAKRTQTES